MKTSRARRLAYEASKQALSYAGTKRGRDAATVALSLALLEVAYQLGSLAEQLPAYGPPEERR